MYGLGRYWGCTQALSVVRAGQGGGAWGEWGAELRGWIAGHHRDDEALPLIRYFARLLAQRLYRPQERLQIPQES